MQLSPNLTSGNGALEGPPAAGDLLLSAAMSPSRTRAYRSALLPSLLAAALIASACTGEGTLVEGEFGPTDLSRPPDSDGTAGGAGGGSDVEEEAPAPAFAPAPLTVRTLLSYQYRNAVSDLLGAAAAAVVVPPSDTMVNGFSAIGAAQLALSSTAIRQFELSAHAAAEKAFGPTAPGRAARVPCTPTGASDETCLTTFIKSFGRKAFRRPLEAAEVALYLPVAKDAATAYGDFYRGAQYAAAALLLSPNFLYMVELGAQDLANPNRVKLNGFEVATRLSFFLSGTTPSDALLDAAAAGTLDTPEGIKAQSLLLLQKPTAKQALAAFFDEMLELGHLDKISKDATTYPAFNANLARAMRDETQLFVENLVFEEQGDFRSFFDADYAYVNKDLAMLYGITDQPATGFARRVLPVNHKRGGFLGQASFLSLQSHPRLTSPTYRGKFVRERLLCQQIPAPPDDVDTAAIANSDPNAPKTMRDRLSEHRINTSCSGCHALMDDIGLGLENFDAIGRYRELENGLTINASSTIQGLGSFTGPRELGALLKGDKRVMSCLTRNIFRAATGHVELATEEQPMRDAVNAFAASGYNLKAVMIELAVSDAFRYGAKEVLP